jgi:DnaK suppressor protein
MEEREQIRQKIEAEIRSTRDLVIRYRELSKPIPPENAIGRISRMDAINNRTVNESALKKAETKLRNLEVALSKIDDPDFGKCIKCKQPIPLGRILLMPHSIRCVYCAN